jgi:hypothetical protein
MHALDACVRRVGNKVPKRTKEDMRVRPSRARTRGTRADSHIALSLTDTWLSDSVPDSKKSGAVLFHWLEVNASDMNAYSPIPLFPCNVPLFFPVLVDPVPPPPSDDCTLSERFHSPPRKHWIFMIQMARVLAPKICVVSCLQGSTVAEAEIHARSSFQPLPLIA